MAHESTPMPGGGTAVAMDKASEPPRGGTKTSRVEIEQLDNGSYVTTCFKRPANKRMGMDSYIEPTRNSYPDLEAALDYARQEFGGAAPVAAADAAAPEPEPVAPMPPAPKAPAPPVDDEAY